MILLLESSEPYANGNGGSTVAEPTGTVNADGGIEVEALPFSLHELIRFYLGGRIGRRCKSPVVPAQEIPTRLSSASRLRTFTA